SPAWTGPYRTESVGPSAASEGPTSPADLRGGLPSADAAQRSPGCEQAHRDEDGEPEGDPGERQRAAQHGQAAAASPTRARYRGRQRRRGAFGPSREDAAAI